MAPAAGLLVRPREGLPSAAACPAGASYKFSRACCFYALEERGRGQKSFIIARTERAERTPYKDAAARSRSCAWALGAPRTAGC